MGNVNASRSLDVSDDLNDLLYDLIDIQKKEYSKLVMERIMRCILNLIENKNVNLSLAIFNMLFSVYYNNDAVTLNHDQPWITDLLECVHLQATNFPGENSRIMLYELFSLSLDGDQVHPLSAQILVKFIDHFDHYFRMETRCPQLLRIVKHLLQSEEKENRQLAIFIMYKLEDIFDTNNNFADAMKCTKQKWTMCIALVEHMENDGMHPNLMDDLDFDKYFWPWVVIPLRRALQTDNIDGVYYIVKFIVTSFKLTGLTDWNMLEDFLATTNRIQLYRVDDYFRRYPLFKNFVTVEELELFIKTLVTVPWQWNSIPLFEWLKSLPAEQLEQSPSIGKDLLFKLCSRVLELKDRRLEHWPESVLESKFEATINGLHLEDYLTFIELMYKNRSSEYRDHDCLKLKIVKCRNFEKFNIHFNTTRLGIIFNSFITDSLVIVFIDKLKQLPKPHHGWLRFFLLSLVNNNKAICNFYSTEYQLNISLIKNCKNLKKLEKHLLNNLICKTNEEKSLVLAIAQDLFIVRQIKGWHGNAMFQLNPHEMLQQGTRATFKHLANLLKNCQQPLQDKNVLPVFVTMLKKYPDCEAVRNIGEYASQHLTIEEQNALSMDIICYHHHINDNIVREIFKSSVNVPIHQILPKIIHITSLNEDIWLEEIYLDSIGRSPILINYIQYTLRKSDSYINQVAEELLRINKELSETNPHYQSNSKQHIIKFYIAEALCHLGSKYKCSDQLWSALFSQNDQFNITCMYELVVAKTLAGLEPLLERLQTISTLEANQQVSLLSVTNIYLHLNGRKLSSEQYQKLLTLLVILTKKKEEKICQFAKFVLDKLIGYFCMPSVKKMQTSVKLNLKNDFDNTSLRAKILIPEIPYLSTAIDDRVLMNFGYMFYMSNLQPITTFRRIPLTKIQHFREAIKSASCKRELMSELMSQNTTVDSADLIVVAALIDDLSSLNELILTCEALGVRTLILNDSTNFSANSGNLNILKLKSESLDEFLYKKKLENYNIVATKKSAESADLLKFSFAKKTILLFGNKKHGIPENLIRFLDKTVELQQMESQRLENLLIFMYHKQFIAKE